MTEFVRASQFPPLTEHFLFSSHFQNSLSVGHTIDIRYHRCVDRLFATVCFAFCIFLFPVQNSVFSYRYHPTSFFLCLCGKTFFDYFPFEIFVLSLRS